MAKLTGPNGKVYDFPDENAPAAMQQGFRPSTPEEVKAHLIKQEVGGVGGQIEAGVLGAARAATFGGSDQALTETGAYAPSELAALRDENPAATGTGEVAGTVASLLVAPEVSGPGLAAKLGTKAAGLVKGGGFLSKLAGKALGGGVEGGLYGLGQFVSEDAIENHPLTAQKLLAQMAGGGLVNGGMSAAGFATGSGLKKGGSALVKFMGGGGLKNALEDFAEKTAVTQYSRQSELKKWGLGDRVNDVGRYGLDTKVQLPNGTTESIFHAGDDAVAINTKAEIARQSEGAALGSLLQQVDAQVPQGSFAFHTGALEARLNSEIIDKIKDDPIKRHVVKELQELMEAYKAGTYTFERAWDLQSSLRTELGPMASEAEKAMARYKHDFQKLFQREIVDQAESLVPGQANALREASKRYGNAAQIKSVTDREMLREMGNRKIGMSSTQIGQAVGLAGAALTGSPLGLLAGVGAAYGNKVMLERGGTIAAVAADRFAKSGAIPRMATLLHKTITNKLTSNPAFGGAFRSILTRAAAAGAGDLMSAHVELARTEPDYLGSVGMSDEDPAAINDFAVKADQMEALHTAVEAQDAKIDAAIGRFLGKQPGASPQVAKRNHRDTFKFDFDRLAQMAADPSALMESLVPQELATAAPMLAAAVGADAMKATQFLYSVAPKNPNPEPTVALGDFDWEPSDRELERWGRYRDAVEGGPAMLLSELKTGELTPEAVEAAQFIYPELLADIQARMMSRLAAYEKPLTFSQKSALSTLFGTPMGGAGDPDRVALIQEAHATTMSAEQQKPKQSGGGKEVSVAKNLATQTQKIEERG